MGGLRLTAGILRMLLGLRGMLLAFRMLILAVRVGGSPMRLSRGFVMFRRLVVFFFHAFSHCWAEECRLYRSAAPIMAASRGDGVFSRLLYLLGHRLSSARSNARTVPTHAAAGVHSVMPSDISKTD